MVTGAANAPDGRRVVLRSYADAFEYDVPDGDVVKALTSGTPRITPLPDEPQGESITYSRDGRSLLTVSESADQPPGTRPTILRYPATDGPATAAHPTGSAAPVLPTAVRPIAEDTIGLGWPDLAAGGRRRDPAGPARHWPVCCGGGTPRVRERAGSVRQDGSMSVLSTLRHPIVAAPMAGGPSTPALVAAVSAAGGLGFLAAGMIDTGRLVADVAEVRARTDRPFGVNLFLPDPGGVDEAAIQAYAQRLAPLAASAG